MLKINAENVVKVVIVLERIHQEGVHHQKITHIWIRETVKVGVINRVRALVINNFFGIANHPTAILTITNVKKDPKAGNFVVTADLTIKGITKPIEFVADVKDHAAKATISIERTQYGIKYGSGSFFDGLGDKMIYDNFDLSVNLVLQH